MKVSDCDNLYISFVKGINMTIQEIMKRIKLSEEAQCVVQEQKMTEEDYERWKVLFQTDLKMFLEEWKNQNEYKEKALYF